jgi:cytochrome P450
MRDAGTIQELLDSEVGRRDPYPLYAELHELGPVLLVEGGHRFRAMVLGYQAVNRLLRHAGFRVVDSEQMDNLNLPWRDHNIQSMLMRSMFFMNEPKHTQLRKMFGLIFTPSGVRAFAPKITEIVDTHIDAMAERGVGGSAVDFIAEFALKVPGDVISDLMGVPPGDRAWFLPRAQAFGDALDLGASPPEVLAAGDRSASELAEFFADLVRQDRVSPRDNFITAIRRLYADAGLDDIELVAGLITFFNAGFVTTTHLFGNGIALLASRPDAVAALQADPGLATGFVEEILRYEAPTHFVVRWTDEAQDLDGVKIPAKSSVLVLISAAGRDPARYDNPNAFDPFRPDIRPLTFGAGPHYCLGHTLSRLEGEIGLARVLERFPRISVVGEPAMLERYTLRGYGSLPVVLAA